MELEPLPHGSPINYKKVETKPLLFLGDVLCKDENCAFLLGCKLPVWLYSVLRKD